MQRFYKALNESNAGPYQPFDFTPYLPRPGVCGQWIPGPWLPPVAGELIAGEPGNGYHVAGELGFPGWVNARNYEVQIAGGYAGNHVEVAARQMRFLQPMSFTQEGAREFCLSCLRLAAFTADRPTPPVLELEEAVRAEGADYVALARSAARTVLSALEGNEWPAVEKARQEIVLRRVLWLHLRIRMVPEEAPRFVLQ